MRRLFASLLVVGLSWSCRSDPVASSIAVNRAEAPLPTAIRVVVVGAGLAGLTAAYELKKRGIPTQLLEATDVWGGRVATAYYGEGLYGEYGMQEMWEGNPLLDLARELNVELDGEPEEPFSSVIIDGKLKAYVQPSAKEYFLSFMSAEEERALSSWRDAARVLRARAHDKGLDDPEIERLRGISFAQWLEESKLPHAPREWLRLTIECELASGASGFSALVALLEMGIFLGEGVPNYHVKGGNQRLVDRIAEAIPEPKTLGALVTDLDRRRTPEGDLRVTVTYVKNHRVQKVEAERVVLAVPFVRLHQIDIDPPLADDRWYAIQGLGLGQYTVVHLLVDKAAAKLWEAGGSPFPVLSDGPLGVIYGPMHASPASSAVEVFSLLVYGQRARMFHMVPRSLKVKEILAELDVYWPGLSAHVQSTHVYGHHPTALPVWPPGRAPIDPQAALLREPDLGVYLAGDYTLGGHSDAAVKSGLAAARAIAAELGAE